jgi:hypothetical protein
VGLLWNLLSPKLGRASAPILEKAKEIQAGQRPPFLLPTAFLRDLCPIVKAFFNLAEIRIYRDAKDGDCEVRVAQGCHISPFFFVPAVPT